MEGEGRGGGEKKKRNIWRRPRRERSRRHPSLKVLTTDNSGTREGDKEKEGGGGKKEEARGRGGKERKARREGEKMGNKNKAPSAASGCVRASNAEGAEERGA